MNLFILMFGLFFSMLTNAEIYEIIDENGRKIYTDTPPLDRPDAQPVSVTPETGNSWQNDSLQDENEQYYDELDEEEQAAEEAEEKELAEQTEQEEKSMDAVTEAEEALEEAKEIKAGDYLPNPNQGMHPSVEYLDRVKKAEENLQKAKKEASEYE